MTVILDFLFLKKRKKVVPVLAKSPRHLEGLISAPIPPLSAAFWLSVQGWQKLLRTFLPGRCRGVGTHLLRSLEKPLLSQ